MMASATQELHYFDTSRIARDTIAQAPIMAEVSKRTIEIYFEAFSARPQDIFFFSMELYKFVGRKSLSTLSLEQKITGTKCSRITADMILGVVCRDQITDQGVILSFKPLRACEKLGIFNALKQNPLTDLYFPYPFLNAQNVEDVSPDEFWVPTPEQVSSLNAGEEHIRRYTQNILQRFNLTNMKIYDPACSTGQFLSAIKKAYPSTYCIGQDLNKQMVEYTRQNSCLDELHEGSADVSPVADESVDFIFFRFLNLEVVDTRLAHALFSKIANRCKNGGHIIVLGHTPILLSAEWFERLGLVIEQTIGHDDVSVFQYYILQKNQPVPEFHYEDFHILTSQAPMNQRCTGNPSSFFHMDGKKSSMSTDVIVPDVMPKQDNQSM